MCTRRSLRRRLALTCTRVQNDAGTGTLTWIYTRHFLAAHLQKSMQLGWEPVFPIAPAALCMHTSTFKHTYTTSTNTWQHCNHAHTVSCVCVGARCPWLSGLVCVGARCPWLAPAACPLGQAQASELAAACKAAMIAAPAGAARRWGATGRRRASPRVAPIAPHHLAQVAPAGGGGRRRMPLQKRKKILRRRESQEFWRDTAETRL